MKRFILSISFLILTNIYSFAQSGQVYIKAEVTAVYTSINDDNGSDEYRWNLGLNWGGMQCISASGGPGWYGRYAMLMNTTYPAAPGSFVFNVDFFEDAQCGGFDCTFKGSNCGVLKKDAGRCQGDHGFNYLANPPGQTHVVNITDICGPGVWGIQCQYYYTPFRPEIPEPVDLNTNKCGGKEFKMKTVLKRTSLLNWTQAKFVWQEETNNSGIWVTIPGQVDSILTVTPPSFSTGFIKKKYRAYSVMNGVKSLSFSGESQEITIWPTAPNMENTNTYRTITHVKCNGGFTGSVKVNQVDGIGNYKYLIQKIGGGGAFYNGNSTDTYPTFSNMPMGLYRLVVENNNGAPVNCYDYIDFWINEPPRLTIASLTSLQFNGYNVSCKGGNNGSINIAPNGGVPPYDYTISKGAFLDNNTTGSFVNLNAGTYSVSLQDANSCSVLSSIIITEPSTNVSYSLVATNVKCNGNNDGIINFNAYGGIGSYSYSINNGGSYSPSATFNNLSPGTYICSAKDANGCLYRDTTVTITQPTKLLLSTGSTQDVTCYGGNDGALSVSGTGGLGVYKYSLNNGLYLNTPKFSSISAGNHKVKIKDGNNCIDSVNVLVNQPDELNIDFTIEQVQCTGFDNGKVKAYVTGGTKPYQYTWTGFSDTDSTIENLSPGNYFLSVKDDHNCPVSKTANVTEPSNELTAFISKSIDAKCNIVCNGEAEVTVTGGTPPYSYKWNNSSLTTALISNLCKGDYEVKILDGRNCAASIETTISDSVQFNINIADSTILCPGKSLFVDAENPGSAYEWYKSGSLFSNNQSLTLNEDASYSLKVTKPDGCYTERNFKLRTSNEALQANFILPSFVALGDTVVFVEISQPLPDSLSWSFEGGPQIINSNSESPVLLFSNEGSYKIKLTAYLGECIDSLSKHITFFIPPVDTTSGKNVTLGLNKIKEIKLYPNPNDGVFKIEIILDQVQDVDLRIFSSQGLPITNLTDIGRDQYIHDFNLPLGNGIYLVKVQTSTDYKTITFIVN